MDSWTHGPFLLSAAPGAGKTRPALELARRELRSGQAGAVVVACPTAPLTRQWARAASELGVQLAQATLDQLERSVELLVGKLTSKR